MECCARAAKCPVYSYDFLDRCFHTMSSFKEKNRPGSSQGGIDRGCIASNYSTGKEASDQADQPPSILTTLL